MKSMVDKFSTMYSRGSGTFVALNPVEQTSVGFTKNMSLSGRILLSINATAKLFASSNVKSPVMNITTYLILAPSWKRLGAVWHMIACRDDGYS